MSEMTIKKFAKKHGACKDSVKWALEHCKSMREAWDTIKAEDVVWIATRPGVLTDKEQRLFACWSVRLVWHLLADPRSRNAVEVSERYANGEATDEELAAASAAAYAAAWDAARAAQAKYLRGNCKPNFRRESTCGVVYKEQTDENHE